MRLSFSLAHLVAAYACLFIGTANAAQKVTLNAKWTVGPAIQSATPPRIVREGEPKPVSSEAEQAAATARMKSQKVGLRIGAKRPDGTEVAGAVFNPNSKASENASFWELTATDKDGRKQVVKTTLVARKNGQGQIPSIVLFPDKQPDPKLTYRIAPANGANLDGVLISDFTITNEKDFPIQAIESKFLPDDIAYVNGNKALEPSIAFKTGKGSTASLKLFWGFQQWEEGKHLRVQALLDAEGTYKPKNKGNYLSKVNGEIDGLYLFPDFEMPALGLHALEQVGFDARVESDQYFDNVHGAVGLSTWTAINGSSIQAFANALCLYGDLDISAPSPVLTINYELVTALSRDDATRKRISETTTDRLRAHLFWSIKLAHKIPLQQVWDRLDIYDVDFVIDSGFSYDFREALFLPDVNLSLEIGPSAVDKSKPTFTITYVNGKANTRFENYNAVLAGVKLPF